jgi:glycosyltransferase involved in cell wall biosynthesis
MIPKITILIRVHRRPTLLARCIHSVKIQTYPNWDIIASYEDDIDFKLIKENGITKYIKVEKESENCFFNLYCNHLKDKVEDGYFFFLDSDDMLINETALEDLSEHLINEDELIICQFMRGSNPKPSNELIKQKIIQHSKIGLPCLIIHSKYKNIAHLGDTTDADYYYAMELFSYLKTKFISLPVVQCDRRSYGIN